jgi:hypothetical protein
MDSILNSVKAYLGIQPELDAFDSELYMAINAVMLALNQLGVGPDIPYVVSSPTQTWSDLLGDEPVGGVREYVAMRVKMLFDPSRNNQIMDALKEQINEFEWRIVEEYESKLRGEETSE